MAGPGVAAGRLIDLLARGREDAVAIRMPASDTRHAPPLTHGRLRKLIADTVAALNAAGVGRGDRVAIVLPNGPEMATSFLGVAAGAVAAPLNPSYTESEFRFYLEDLRAKAVIVAPGDGGARTAAHALGVAVLELTVPAGAAAGEFKLSGSTGARASHPGLADAADSALVLHTSGTTARPKIVPLSQANLCASAANIAATLALQAEDCCLNVMPLFHIHGLIGALLSSLSAGASVAATPGFNALRFAAWMSEIKPSWYSAVPTMHQAILARAERDPAAAAGYRLRFIRSSSAALPPQVMAGLEKLFLCPVIESYGMTEAAHQMTSNPLPPRARKAGTVGIAAGPEVATMDADGRILPRGAAGEVVIRGANVTAGYENNPTANASAFAHGWFHTGDLGVIDAEGYLTISGRLKEIINRGGEKISPREVDEALLDHPAVGEAITFAVPHDKLGEEVAAAVVLKPGATASEQEVRAFLGERLAGFKVPRKVLFLAELPKGPTGKPQRIGLAKRLGLAP
ncbi:MAG: AMP-dependent synthetase [Alphaproteobacteria bacterium]|nr:AMP-dependent synthetase [Alphaproteobacteria bacterium]